MASVCILLNKGKDHLLFCVTAGQNPGTPGGINFLSWPPLGITWSRRINVVTGRPTSPEAIEDYHIQEFTRSGFRGGLNWYRNIDRMWEFSAPFCGAQLQQPTLFVAGEVDAVLTMYPDAVAKLEQTVPNLTKKVILPGAGHWIQQERPTEVNALLVEFLKSV